MTGLQITTRDYIDRIIRANDPPSFEQIKDLYKQLKRDQYFGDARKLIGHYRDYHRIHVDIEVDKQLWRDLTHWYSLCTYKDVDLSPSTRFDAALKILGELGDVTQTKDQETLGQAGGIFKNRWEIFNQRADLHRSYEYYIKGYNIGDQGAGSHTYPAINAAFLLDLLALQEVRHAKESGATSTESAKNRRRQAQEIRQKLVDFYTRPNETQTQSDKQQFWWDKVTLAEAYFGLEEFDQAIPLLESAKNDGVDEWQKQATVKQLAALLEVHAEFSQYDQAKLKRARDALAQWPGAIDWSKTGKVGLALSGGGFRASLFHIGVLARLAECDVLRHVDVLSCVSGGSILGAYYYLELRHLLQSKKDDEITQQDYVDLVKRLEENFVKGVQSDLRTKAIFSLRRNVMAALSRHYTITDYIGQLYEDKLYRRIDDGRNRGPRYLSGLFIHPKEDRKDFYPRRDNWRRRNRVPMLVLNATSLNTGHLWQFTAAWMGEPVAGADAEVDRNIRLTRVYYDEHLPKQYKQFRLGRAVAASSGVPGLFEPVELDGLYENITVRLADGGVHDNQGISSLMQEGCSVILVSDASGQMVSDNKPNPGTLPVLMRSNSILQARVRESGFGDLEARKHSSLLRGLMFLHLKKELEGGVANAIGHKEQADPGEPLFAGTKGRCVDSNYTSYGIDRTIQQQLSAMRTDLDSFSDTEAYALMCSGYAMAKHDLPALKMFESMPIQGNWNFLKLLDAMKPEPGLVDWNRTIKARLRVSNHIALKVWRLVPWSCAIILALLIAIVFGFLWLGSPWSPVSLLNKASSALVHLTTRATGLNGLLATTVVTLIVLCVGAFSGRARRIVLGAIMIPGSLIGMVHRHIYDRLFLSLGSLSIHKEKQPLIKPKAVGVGAGKN